LGELWSSTAVAYLAAVGYTAGILYYLHALCCRIVENNIFFLFFSIFLQSQFAIGLDIMSFICDSPVVYRAGHRLTFVSYRRDILSLFRRRRPSTCPSIIIVNTHLFHFLHRFVQGGRRRRLPGNCTSSPHSRCTLLHRSHCSMRRYIEMNIVPCDDLRLDFGSRTRNERVSIAAELIDLRKT